MVKTYTVTKLVRQTFELPAEHFKEHIWWKVWNIVGDKPELDIHAKSARGTSMLIKSMPMPASLDQYDDEAMMAYVLDNLPDTIDLT